MAITKKDSLSSKVSSIGSSQKGSSTTGSSSIKPNDFQNPNPKPKTSINDSIKITINENSSKVEFSQDVSYNELLSFLQIKTMGVTKSNPERQILTEFKDCLIENQSKKTNSSNSVFSLSISPSRGVNCTLLTANGGFSYRLERKKKEMLTRISTKSSSIVLVKWDLVSEATSYGYLHVKDESVDDGCTYTYRLKITNLKNNASQEFEYSILYKKTSVAEFYARPDIAVKRIVIHCDIKNAGSVKITRAEIVTNENTKKKEKINSVEIINTDKFEEISFPYEDKKVDTGKEYQYDLEALDLLTSVPITRSSTVDCKSIVPEINEIKYSGISISSRKTEFKWSTSNSVSNMILERRVATDNQSPWITILSNSYKNNYPESFSVCDSDSLSVRLLPDTSYEYKITCSNGWGKSSKTVNVQTPPAPGKIRLLPPEFSPDGKEITCNFRWIGMKNVVRYEISRRNCTRNYDDVTKRLDGSANSIACSIHNDVLYTYEIKAINAWGTSVRYLDVKRKNIVAKNDANCYRYIGQNTNSDYDGQFPHKWQLNFQGITTDGEWWYLTNGDRNWDTLNPPSIRKTPVKESLNTELTSYKKCPDAEHVHIGDLDCFEKYLFVAVYKTNEDNWYNNDENKCYGEIWIYNKDSLKRITTTKLYYKDVNGADIPVLNTPWCAVNPCDKRLYTSQKNIDGDSKIFSFEINFDNIRRIDENNEQGLEVLSSPLIVDLFDDGNKAPFIKQSMQGGCFDHYNNLYLLSGFKHPEYIGPGIHVFKLVCDEDAALQSFMKDAKNDEERAEKYESFISGDWNSTCSYTKAVLVANSDQPYKYTQVKYKNDEDKKKITELSLAKIRHDISAEEYEQQVAECYHLRWLYVSKEINTDFIYQFNVLKEEEPEGLCYYDFRYAPPIPENEDEMQKYVKEGSLHASLLMNDIATEEYMLLKHYEHKYEETEEKNLYYDNENLRVVHEQIFDDNGNLIVDREKIYDNGILLKSFDTGNSNNNKVFADASKIILESFNKVHTIGWLQTSSPNHNYEFSALTKKVKTIPIDNNIAKVITYNPTQFVDSIKPCAYGYFPSQERYDIKLIAGNGDEYHFYAHNENDAISICSILSQYKKLCYIGVGPDKDGPDIGRIRSTNNLIWLE